MTREDLFSSMILVALCLVFWSSGMDGRAPGSPGSPSRSSAVARRGDLAWEFGSGRNSFRVSAPAEWQWIEAVAGAEATDGWHAIGCFIGSEVTVQVASRRLEREIRVEDWVDYECRLLRLSLTRIHPPQGRRPQSALAEVWDGEGGSRRDGVLVIAKLGDRLYRAGATISPNAPPAAMRTIREVLLSFQPLGTVAATCAEDIAVWRPHFGSPLALPYPSSWNIQDAALWLDSPLLHLRSRLGGKTRGVMLLAALDPKQPVRDAHLTELLEELHAREPGFRLADRSDWVDTECESGRFPGRGRLLVTRLPREAETWEIQVLVLGGRRARMVLLQATPTRGEDPYAWMINRAAHDLVAEEAREE